MNVGEDVKRKVYETFGRNEKMVEDDVNIIKTWMKTQPHLPELMDDVKIRNFLNLNKYSIEKTKAKIDMYYTIRSVIPELFEVGKRRLEITENVFNTTYIFTFPKLLNDVHRVYFSKQKKGSTLDPMNIYNIINIWFSIFEIRLYEDFMTDDYVVVDLENHSLHDMTVVTPSFMLKCLAVHKKVYALRVKKIIFVNCPPYISTLSRLLKSVLKPKIFDRAEFHQDAEVMKTIFAKEDLPKEYGGEGPSLEEYNDMMRTKFHQYENRFEHLDKLRVDEKLRPEKLNNDDILGFYGSFKKLDVD